MPQKISRSLRILGMGKILSHRIFQLYGKPCHPSIYKESFRPLIFLLTSFFQDYQDLLEKEEFRDTEDPDEDPTCYDTIHNGRDVSICLCTGDKCNAADGLNNGLGYIVVLGLIASAVNNWQ